MLLQCLNSFTSSSKYYMDIKDGKTIFRSKSQYVGVAFSNKIHVNFAIPSVNLLLKYFLAVLVHLAQ